MISSLLILLLIPFSLADYEDNEPYTYRRISLYDDLHGYPSQIGIDEDGATMIAGIDSYTEILLACERYDGLENIAYPDSPGDTPPNVIRMILEGDSIILLGRFQQYVFFPGYEEDIKLDETPAPYSYYVVSMGEDGVVEWGISIGVDWDDGEPPIWISSDDSGILIGGNYKSQLYFEAVSKKSSAPSNFMYLLDPMGLVLEEYHPFNPDRKYDTFEYLQFDVSDEDCLNGTCFNGAACLSFEYDEPMCACSPGFTGKSCQEIAENQEVYVYTHVESIEDAQEVYAAGYIIKTPEPRYFLASYILIEDIPFLDWIKTIKVPEIPKGAAPTFLTSSVFVHDALIFAGMVNKPIEIEENPIEVTQGSYTAFVTSISTRGEIEWVSGISGISEFNQKLLLEMTCPDNCEILVGGQSKTPVTLDGIRPPESSSYNSFLFSLSMVTGFANWCKELFPGASSGRLAAMIDNYGTLLITGSLIIEDGEFDGNPVFAGDGDILIAELERTMSTFETIVNQPITFITTTIHESYEYLNDKTNYTLPIVFMLACMGGIFFFCWKITGHELTNRVKMATRKRQDIKV